MKFCALIFPALLGFAAISPGQDDEPGLELQLNLDDAGRVRQTDAFVPETPGSAAEADATAPEAPNAQPTALQSRNEGWTAGGISLITGAASLLAAATIFLIRRARFENAFGRTFAIPATEAKTRLGAARSGGCSAAIHFGGK